MMGQANLYGQKASGFNINGIIKDYHAYAGENISPGDLVEYVNGVSYTEYTNSDPINLFDESKLKCFALSEFKVLICYLDTTVDPYCVYGTICSIKGVDIIPGTSVKLFDFGEASSYDYSVTIINDKKFFITFNNTANNYLYGVVCNVFNSNITVGSSKVINNTSDSGKYAYGAKLTDGTVFVLYWAGNVYGVVCSPSTSISSTSFSIGTNVMIRERSGTNITTVTGLTALSETSVFVAYPYNSRAIVTICTISGTTITASDNNYQLGSNYQYMRAHPKFITLNSTKVFAAFDSGGTYQLYAKIFNISGTSISVYSDYQLSANSYSGFYLSASKLSETEVFVVHQWDNSSITLGGIICTISGSSIIAGTVTEISDITGSGTNPFVTLVSDNNFLVCFNKYSQFWSVDGNLLTNKIVVPFYETQIQKVTTNKFDGIAKTGGVGKETGIPINNIVVNGDFSDGLNNIEVDSYKKLSEYAVIRENNENILKIKTITTMSSVSHFLRFPVVIDTSHVYYMRASVKGEINYTDITSSISYFEISCYGLGIPGGSNSVHASTSWQNFSAYGSPTESSNYIMISGQTDGNYYYFIKDVMLCDLTAEFGAGNEPTKEWCDKHLVIENRDLISIYTKSYDIITNGGFENNLNGWETTTIAESSINTESYRGNKSCLIDCNYSNYTTSYQRIISAKGDVIAGHKYYYRIFVKVLEYTSGIIRVAFYGQIKDLVQSEIQSILGIWTPISSLREIGSSASGTNILSLMTIMLNENTPSKFKLLLDDCVVYDLTDMFGKGNEPTQEWCDENLTVNNKNLISITYGLLANTDFSDGLAYWVNPVTTTGSNRISEASIIEMDGENVLKFKPYPTVSQSRIFEQTVYDFKYTHIYYGKFYVKSDDSFVADTYDYVMCSLSNILNTGNRVNPTNSWQLSSFYSSGSAASTSVIFSITGELKRGFQNYFYLKDIKLYDLTDMYGEGNEPTKEWCDENL